MSTRVPVVSDRERIFTTHTLPSRQYHFTGRNGVFLALVDENDLEQVTNKLVGCCNKKRRVYRVATPQELELWNSL